MVGDSRRSRNPKNWRNIKKLFKYQKLQEEESKNEIDKKKIYNEKNKDNSNKYLTTSKKFGKGYSWKKVNKMSKSVQSYLNFLKTVSRKTPSKRRAILKEFNEDSVLFDALSELSHNLIENNIKLNSDQWEKISRYEKVLNQLDCPKSKKCKKKRRILIEQSGGFLPILIPAAVAALDLLSGAIINKIVK
jgi:hypothetical protein